MQARSNEIGHEIIQVEAQQAAFISSNKPSNAALDERLEKLYRENVRLCEEVQHLLEENQPDTSLQQALEILAALRQVSEAQVGQAAVKELSTAQADTKRAASGKLSRVKKASKGAAVADEVEAEATPSPRILLSARNAKEKTARQKLRPDDTRSECQNWTQMVRSPSPAVPTFPLRPPPIQSKEEAHDRPTG